ncbi:MAG: S8 family serine peptidase [Oscillatoriales cyanobacterium C42_A2020_001]|nr:S8 family serine peptidase [Leptolyngbyaceae cyanobacterium C42_A2020_001]
MGGYQQLHLSRFLISIGIGLIGISSPWAAIAQSSNPFQRSEAGKTSSKPLPPSSIGSTGIDALRLHQAPYNLTGRKIAIGQVEIGRPGQFGIDKAVAQNRSMFLTRVFYRDSHARTNTNVDSHAQNVASIMISASKSVKGVAPGARLFSSAAGTPRRYGQPEECLSAQHIAMQNGGDVRAINFSFGESLRHDPRPNPLLDGNALLTQCLDWSARVHNVLYVVAGNQGKGGISVPTDNYNGINVAFTNRIQGVFARVDFANLGDPASGAIEGMESNVGPRRAISLVAPGNEISMVNPNGTITTSSGTSFAAPHVTGTVALLQEYGDRQLRVRCKGAGCSEPWTVAARQSEVMKAVLLNSAEKMKDPGDGLTLGMSRTIVDKVNRNWLESEAYRDPQIPLNIQMGAGQINAFRAYQQFSPGQWSPEKLVPAIGWDYRTVESGGEGREMGKVEETFKIQDSKFGSADSPEAKIQNSLTPQSPIGNRQSLTYRDYVLEKPLRQGSFVSITLTWNRLVELVDTNQNGDYDLGEEFRDRGLNNLDLYLMRVDDDDPQQNVSASISDVDSVEHIFAKVPATGRYKIRVQFRDRINNPVQPYALAWWTVPVK